MCPLFAVILVDTPLAAEDAAVRARFSTDIFARGLRDVLLDSAGLERDAVQIVPLHRIRDVRVAGKDVPAVLVDDGVLLVEAVFSHSMFEWQIAPAAYLAARADEAKIAMAGMRYFMVVGFGLLRKRCKSGY